MGSEKGGFWKRDLFKDVHFLEKLAREPPDCGKKENPKIFWRLENSKMSEIPQQKETYFPSAQFCAAFSHIPHAGQRLSIRIPPPVSEETHNKEHLANAAQKDEA